MRGPEEISRAIASSVSQMMEEGVGSFFLPFFFPFFPRPLLVFQPSVNPAVEPLHCARVVGDSHVISKSLSCGGWIVA